jgi:2-polyprenyl-3-methyl-5-hydroxy-6-metoxy-1,4-benzoquinol methylase
MKINQKCPVCGKNQWGETLVAPASHGSTLVKDTESYTYVQCLCCGTWSLQYEKIDKKFYDKHYSDTYYSKPSGIKIVLEKVFSTYRNWSRQRLILQLHPQNGKKLNILDIGSGDGNFIASLSSDVFLKSAIDVEDMQKENAKPVIFYKGDFLTMGLPIETFDVITAWHVIEHISNTQLFLERASGLLKKDGVLILSTPNSDSFGFQKGKAAWFHLDAPRHVVIFSQKGLQLAAGKKLQIKEVLYENFEFPLDVFWTQKRLGKSILNALASTFIKFNRHETFTAVFKKV